MDGSSAADSIAQIFRVDATTLTAAIRTAAEADSILATIAGIVNFAALVAAVVFQGGHLISAILQQGQHGRTGGRYSMPFAVLRTCFLYTMLLPLGSGYSLIQALVLWIGMGGSGLADTAWDRSNEHLIDRMQLAQIEPPRHLQQISPPLAAIESCALGIQRAAAGAGGGTRSNVSVSRPETWATADTDREAVRQLRYDGGGDLPAAALCGAITLRRQLPPAGDSVESRTLRAIALRAIELQQHDLLDARAAVRQVLQRRFAGELNSDAFRREMLAIETRYMHLQARQARVVNREISRLESKLRAAQLQHAKAAGWLFAGAFYFTMSSFDDRMNAAVFSQPAFVGPRISEFPPSLARDVTPYITAAHALMPTGVLNDSAQDNVVAERLEAEAALRLDTRTRSIERHVTPDTRLGWALRNWFKADTQALAQLQNKASDLGREVLHGFTKLGSGDGRGFVPRLVALGHVMLTGAGILILAGTVGGISTFALMLPLLFPFAAGGILLAYVLPALPLIIWIAGVAGWLLMLVQALFGAPLWAATHADPSGEALTHARSTHGYMLVISLLARPLLLLAGLIGSMLLLEFVGHYIFKAFAVFYNAHDGSGVGADIAGALVAITLICTVTVVIARWSFSLILTVPDSVLRWIGGATEALGESEIAEQARSMAISALAKVSTGGTVGGTIAGLRRNVKRGLTAR